LPVSFPEHFNMADYFLYHNLEDGREHKVCLYFEDQEWSYGEVARLSNQTGNALRAFGAGIEDRVLLVLPDCPEFVWTWFGAARIGSVITMVNPLLPAADYEYYLDYTRARVASVHESVLRAFSEAAAAAR
jgi:benzoate-CoA ligase